MSEALRKRLAALPQPKIGDMVRIYDLRDDAVIQEGKVVKFQVVDLPMPAGYMHRKTLVIVDGLDAAIPIACCEVIA